MDNKELKKERKSNSSATAFRNLTISKDMALSKTAKIGIGWTFAVFGGLYAFVLSKRSIDAKRYETMKARERVRNSNYID